MNKTKIEYMTHSWNPIAMRCTPVSEGCEHCWHLIMANRLSKNPKVDPWDRAHYAGCKDQAGEIIGLKSLNAPSKRKKPARIGVQFMGDLFHKSISHRARNQIFEAMDVADWHTYLLLTKRPDIALDFDKWRDESWLGYPHTPWKDHIWLGVTIEHPKYGYRADYLRKIPAAVRFLSLEPLLADFSEYPGILDGMNWCVVGGESGPGARPMHLDWVRSVRDQCQVAGVMFFYKQTIINGGKISLPFLDGQQWAQYPTPGH